MVAKKNANRLPEPAYDPKAIKIAVIGSTGTGKSTLINALGDLGSVVDKVKKPPRYAISGLERPSPLISSAKAKSCTSECLEVTIEFPDSQVVRIVDTPGLGDTDGRDSMHIANMVEHLRREKHINLFIVVLNGTNPRFDQHMQDMITIFAACFGAEFMSNIMFVYTNWSNSDDAKAGRDVEIEAHNELESTVYSTMEDLRSDEVNLMLKTKYNYDGKPPNKVFIDSLAVMNTKLAGEKGKHYDRFVECASVISDVASTMPAFDCIDIKAVKTLLDRTSEELGKLRSSNEKMKERFEKERKEHSDEVNALGVLLEKVSVDHKEGMDAIQVELSRQKALCDSARNEAHRYASRLAVLEVAINQEKDEAKVRMEAEIKKLKEEASAANSRAVAANQSFQNHQHRSQYEPPASVGGGYSTSGGGVKKNAWHVFLSKHKGKGYSMAQLSQKYQAQR